MIRAYATWMQPVKLLKFVATQQEPKRLRFQMAWMVACDDTCGWTDSQSLSCCPALNSAIAKCVQAFDNGLAELNLDLMWRARKPGIARVLVRQVVCQRVERQ